MWLAKIIKQMLTTHIFSLSEDPLIFSTPSVQNYCDAFPFKNVAVIKIKMLLK